jgi:predicted RNase H-like HicB family nuclease
MIFFVWGDGNPLSRDNQPFVPSIRAEFGGARWPCFSQYNISMKHYTLPIIIERDAEGFYVYCPPLQGCYSQGDTYDEALSNIKDAIQLHLEERPALHQ